MNAQQLTDDSGRFASALVLEEVGLVRRQQWEHVPYGKYLGVERCVGLVYMDICICLSVGFKPRWNVDRRGRFVPSAASGQGAKMNSVIVN